MIFLLHIRYPEALWASKCPVYCKNSYDLCVNWILVMFFAAFDRGPVVLQMYCNSKNFDQPEVAEVTIMSYNRSCDIFRLERPSELMYTPMAYNEAHSWFKDRMINKNLDVRFDNLKKYILHGIGRYITQLEVSGDWCIWYGVTLISGQL